MKLSKKTKKVLLVVSGILFVLVFVPDPTDLLSGGTPIADLIIALITGYLGFKK